jgi:hypothetical protein
VGELVGEDCSDYGLAVGIMRDVHEYGVGADVGAFAEWIFVRYCFSMRIELCAGERGVSARGL